MIEETKVSGHAGNLYGIMAEFDNPESLLDAANRARLVRSVEAEVVSTWNRAEASRQRLEVLDGATIPAAREAAELSRIAYQEGRLDLLRLLESERTLADIRANRIETWVLWGSQRASLERLVGGVL